MKRGYKQYQIQLFNRKTEAPYLEPVAGKSVKLSSAPNHSFFVHRPPTAEFSYFNWRISEEQTGLMVAHGMTQKKAIETANRRITNNTKDTPLQTYIDKSVFSQKEATNDK